MSGVICRKRKRHLCSSRARGCREFCESQRKSPSQSIRRVLAFPIPSRTKAEPISGSKTVSKRASDSITVFSTPTQKHSNVKSSRGKKTGPRARKRTEKRNSRDCLKRIQPSQELF